MVVSGLSLTVNHIMRLRIIRVTAVVVIPLVTILVFAFRPRTPRPTVRAYFTNAMGLRPGAAVRIAGVNVGLVESVRAKPELKEAPAEVVIALDPPYDSKIPSDSVVQLKTAGLLGETYVDIDASTAFGPPLTANGVLKTRPTVTLSAQDILEKVDADLKRIASDANKNLGSSGRQPLPAPTKPAH